MGAPTQLGPFRVVRELSRGGVGVVHEAVHDGTGGRYAVKVLLRDTLGRIDPNDLERFARESEALGKLRHPHIVGVHAADLKAPTPYLVQDLLTGGTLQDRIATGVIPIDEAVDLTIKLASGIQAAHDHGVLHRDLKPSNVLFDDRGEPRVVDFGLACSTGKGERLTLTGSLLGTPSYMAPEQALALKTEDVRTDVYGLGALLYAMLTGQPPIPPQANVINVIAAVSKGNIPRPSTLRRDLPRHVESVCMRALAKDPAQRFPSAQAFGEALADPTAGESAPRLTPGLALAGAVVLGVVGAVAALALVPTQPDAQPTPLVDPVPQVQRDFAKEARDELAAGEGIRARAVADDAQAAGAPGDWERVRGLSLVLEGDLNRARGLLRADDDLMAVELEEGRLKIDAALEEMTRKLTQRSAATFEVRLAQGQELLDLARLARKLEIGPVLATRLHATLIRLALDADRTVYVAHEQRLKSFLDDIEAHATVEHRWGVRVTRLLLEREVTARNSGSRWFEVAERADDLLNDPELPDRFKATAWALDHNIRLGQEQLDADAVPRAGDVNQLGYLENNLLQTTYKQMARLWSQQQLVASYQQGDAPGLAHAYRQAVGLFLLHRKHNYRRGPVPAESTRLYMASMYLKAKQVAKAEAELEGQFAPRFHHKVAYLKLECALLRPREQGEQFHPLDTARGPDSVHDDCLALQAAYHQRRGEAAAAQECLSRLRGRGNYLFGFPWRLNGEVSLADERGEGFRAALVLALKE